jgi:hypothetical protein
MRIDRSNEAQTILDEQRAKRPRWYRSASKATPSWFSGGELDLLEAHERAELFLSLGARNRPAWNFLFILAAANVPNITKHIVSNTHRTLWICVAVGYAIIAVGAWLTRRRTILATARRQVREGANWPLIAQQHAG